MVGLRPGRRLVFSRVMTEARLGGMRLNGSVESGYRPRHLEQSGKQTHRLRHHGRGRSHGFHLTDAARQAEQRHAMTCSRAGGSDHDDGDQQPALDHSHLRAAPLGNQPDGREPLWMPALTRRRQVPARPPVERTARESCERANLRRPRPDDAVLPSPLLHAVRRHQKAGVRRRFGQSAGNFLRPWARSRCALQSGSSIYRDSYGADAGIRPLMPNWAGARPCVRPVPATQLPEFTSTDRASGRARIETGKQDDRRGLTESCAPVERSCSLPFDAKDDR